ALIVAHRTVVEAGITGDVVEGLLTARVMRQAPDDYRELAFEIIVLRDFRAHHLAALPHERIRITRKEHRVGGRVAASFLDMRAVVQPDANDLLRIGDG